MKGSLAKTAAYLEPHVHLEVGASFSVVRLGEDILDVGRDMSLRQGLSDILDGLAQKPSIRAVLFLPCSGSLSPERCEPFLAEAQDQGKPRGGTASTAAWGHGMWLSREEYTFCSVMRKTMSMPKPVVLAVGGNVVFSFLGIALGCDYRIVSTETVFHNLCHKLGIPPAFGLLYQLPLHIGVGTARRLLLREERIDAQRALDLGLVDELVPPDRLEERAKAVARELGELPGQMVRGIKRMLLQRLPSLDKHFERECEEILAATRRLQREY